MSPPVRPLLALLAVLSTHAPGLAQEYKLGPESTVRSPDAPAGTVVAFEFNASRIFPGTRREGWIYLPARLDPAKPAALMVFQDGHAYVATNGQVRVPIVFDNLIAKGEMPVTVGVFVNPGHRGENPPPGAGWGPRDNRSLEYDGLGDAYARFLAEELLPFLTAKHHLNLSADPRQRAICGMSSGGICAFTAAWERPDLFGKVVSHIGSFVNIRGGHVYPALIRKTERKPLRVFLQDGRNDLNNLHGDWPLSNQQMATALAFAGYDHRLVLGEGSHSGQHGGSIFPETLRWLWRPETQPPSPSTNNWSGDEALNKILPDGGKPGDWELASSGHQFTDAACGDAAGNFYFSDLPRGEIWRVAPGGKGEKWLEGGPKVSGLKVGPDGKFYACTQGGPGDEKQRIVVIDPETRRIETVATGVRPNDLVVTKDGRIFYTDTGAGEIVSLPASARGLSAPRPVAGGINAPNGIALSPDHKFLSVSEYKGSNVWSFAIGEDGSLAGGERYMTLVVPTGRAESAGDGAATDAQGRVYVTSHAGIQMFDWTGRLGGVIGKPTPGGTAVSCAFAGPGRAWLYVCDKDKVWRRRTLTKGN
ncbi:MAG: gluconolactonase [Verrucomicrobia bacterium]|nr:MAG: gluconolactonase [Verrucomicrobiota bacterium]